MGQQPKAPPAQSVETPAAPSKEDLLESQDRLGAIAKYSADLIVEVDDEGRFLFVSDKAKEMIGMAPAEMVGRRMTEFAETGRVHPDDYTEGFFASFVAGVPRGRTTDRYESRMLHSDGTWHSLESNFSAYLTSNRRWRAIIITRDVTARVRAEEMLRESEERFRVLTEAAQEIIAETDVEGHVKYASAAVEKATGLTPERFAAEYTAELIHPDDRERVTTAFREASEQGKPSLSGAYRLKHEDGSWHWLETESIPFERADGEQRILVLGRDVTERRNFEEHVRQAQRLEGLGVLAGGIAHDFNNLLTPILGDAGLALADLPDDSPARLALHRIQTAARRAASLTHQMLAYAGQGPLQIEVLDLSSLVREMQQLLESSVAGKAVLESDLADGLPAIEADAAQICQVVMNVIANAAEAVEDRGGKIAIRTGWLPEPPPPSPGRQGATLPKGPVVFFEVEDDGVGMTPDTRARIFDPFFTTKFTGRGLGLAAALGIVRGHHGALEIETAPSRGTLFRVLLPASERSVAPHEPLAAPLAWRRRGTALVIDDDDGVRDLVRETLSRAGLHVHCAASGDEGIALYDRYADEIDFVVLDRTMPATDGAAVFDQIRARRADVRVLLISGYSEQRATGQLTDRGLAGFLQKPFLPEALLEKARELIGD